MEFDRVTRFHDSQTIKAAAYHREARRMRIYFSRNGKIWDYLDVPPTEYAALVAAYSPGAVFNERVRDRYEGVEITVTEEEGRRAEATKKHRGQIVMLDNYEGMQ